MINEVIIQNKNGEQVLLDASIFEIDGEKGMVNLTKIAQACGKRVNHWLELSSTKEVVAVWEEEKGEAVKAVIPTSCNREHGHAVNSLLISRNGFLRGLRYFVLKYWTSFFKKGQYHCMVFLLNLNQKNT